MRKRVALIALVIAGFASAAGAEVDKTDRGSALASAQISKQPKGAWPPSSASIVCAKGGAIAASVGNGTCTIYASVDSRGASLGMEAIVCRDKANGDYAWVNCTSGCVGARGSGRCGVSGF